MNNRPHIIEQRLLLFLLSILISIPQGFTQTQNKAYLIGSGNMSEKKLMEKAVDALSNKQFQLAQDLLEEVVEIGSNNIDDYYLLARAAEGAQDFCVAEEAYIKVSQLDSTNLFPELEVKLIELEEKNKTFLDIDASLEEIHAEAGYMPEEKQAAPVNLGKTINTIHAELNPVWHKNMLYYGSLNTPKKGDGRPYAMTFRSDLNGLIEEWAAFNIPDTSTTHLTFTPDGNRMYFTKCDYRDKSLNIVCEIFYKDKTGTGIDDWGPANPLRINSNPPSVTTHTQPAVGQTKDGQQFLFYASNMPGGFGGLDLYYSEIETDGRVGIPHNMGPRVNTEGNEVTPFFDPKYEILYFSSDYKGETEEGIVTRGDLDIHKVSFRNYDFTAEPEVLLEPINSNANDYNYFIKDTRDQAFLVSNREGCDPEKKLAPGCNDIYVVDLPPCETNVIAYFWEQGPKGSEIEQRKPINNGTVVMGEASSFTQPSFTSGNEFRFEENIPISLERFCGTHPNFEESIATVNIKECEVNVIDIYTCAPTLQISVFEKTTALYGDEQIIGKEIPNCTVKLARIGDVIDTTITQEPNIFNFKINRKENYRIEVSQYAYDPVNLEFSSNQCDTSIIIYLTPELPDPKFDRIACYFDHDIPKRKIKGVVDPTTDTAYNELFERYLPRREAYITGYNGQDVGEKKEENHRVITDFFDGKVDSSYAVLERFRVYLLDKLEALPENKRYFVDIRGFTSNVGTNTYNEELAQRRIESVKRYFVVTHFKDFNKYLNIRKNLFFDDFPVGEDGPGPEKKGDIKNNIFNPVSATKRRVEITTRIEAKPAEENPKETSRR